MGQFKTGDKKPEKSGRKAGTPNKKTLILSEILDTAKYCPVEDLLKILKDKKLHIQDRIRIDLELLGYLYPKRKAIEVKQENSGKIEFVSKDELNEARNA